MKPRVTLEKDGTGDSGTVRNSTYKTVTVKSYPKVLPRAMSESLVLLHLRSVACVSTKNKADVRGLSSH